MQSVVDSVEMVGKAINLADAALEVDDGCRVMERLVCPFCQAVAAYKKARELAHAG